MRLSYALLLAAAAAVAGAAAPPATPGYPLAYASSFLTPTLEPGVDMSGAHTAVDMHCTGNGRTVVCVAANTTAGSVALTLRHADAQGASSDPMTISVAVLTFDPNPFWLTAAGGAAAAVAYNQTLDLATATITVTAGGSASPDDHALQLVVYATTCADLDAQPCDTVVATSHGQVALALTVDATSVRPAVNTSYPISWNCFRGTSAPDEFVAPPLPPSFPPGADASTLVQYHRNEPWDTSLIDTHFAQQNITNLRPVAYDPWTNRTFGVAVLGADGAGAAMARASPSRLVPAGGASTSWDVRFVVHTSQTDTAADWLAQLGAAVSAPVLPYAQHAAWWASFWARSRVEVRTSPAAAAAATAAEAAPTAPPQSADLLLWLRVDDLAAGGTPDGGRVAAWRDASGRGNDAAQADPSKQPVFLAGAGGGSAPGPDGPSVLFDGTATYLAGTALALPVDATVVAVFTDTGSATTCCSGVFYAAGSCRGLSTAVAAAAGKSGAPPLRSILADWCYGIDPHGGTDVTNVSVVASVVYAAAGGAAGTGNSSAVTALLGGSAGSGAASTTACIQSVDPSLPAAAGAGGFMVGSRNAELGRYFRGHLRELLVYGAALNATALDAAGSYLAARWGVPPLPPAACPSGGDPLGRAIATKYAGQRFLNAIQSRGTRTPIRFNGQLVMATLPPHTDTRVWGVLSCWQNDRLAYVPMLANGDGDLHAALLGYMTDRAPLSRARTRQFFGHDGVHWTECKVPAGVPSSKHYDGSCTGAPSSRPPGYPYWQVCVGSGNRFEYGGDGGTPEVGLAALEHWYYTQDAAALQEHLPLATLAAEFYRAHYPARDGDGKVVIAPTGVLEYYWCWTNASVPGSGSPDDCCVNDLPTVAGLTKLLDMLLAVVPPNATDPVVRRQWAALRAAAPPLPTAAVNATHSVLVPAQVMCTAGTNPVEAPELYAVHPYRLLTVGRAAVDATVDLAPARAAFAADPHAYSDNHDWTQGVFDAALLGLVDDAARMVAQRALTGPAKGYRWDGFAPAIYDYSPVSELHAGLQSAVNFMLLQPGDDAAGTLVLFPAWPCEWDVSFSLWGPLATRVSVDYAGGAVLNVTVEPPARAADVVWAGCVTELDAGLPGGLPLPGRVARPGARQAPREVR